LDGEREVEDHQGVERDRISASNFFRNESGATSIEHALLACVFALVIVYAVATGLSPVTIYGRIASMTGFLGDTSTTVPTPARGED
jgi:Flp pilus assembly pilin Flp